MRTRFLRDREGEKDINYTIAEDGSYIRDKRTGKKLDSIYISKYNEYRVITIEINGKYYPQIKICQLQWLAWKGIIPKGYIIHHKDEDKLNDHKNNLDCLTKNEHMRFHWLGEKNPRFGKTGEKCNFFGKFGEDDPASKLSNKQAEKVKFYYFIKNWTYQKIADKFKVSKGTIWRILCGHTYNPDHLTKEEIRETFCY